MLAVFAGGRSVIGDGGHQTGLRKRRRDVILLTPDGVQDDDVVDRRHHGGPDRAVNCYASEHYATLRRDFPLAAESLQAGSVGENLALEGLQDGDVHIGDRWRIGAALVEVSQPRSPCWKLNARFTIDGFSLAIQDRRATGWYLRVLEAGEVRPFDTLVLEQRVDGSPTLVRFWDLTLAEQPDLAALAGLAAQPGLSPDWQQRLAQRVAWLQANRPLA